MILVQHRVNNIAELRNVPHSYGVELDVRYHNNDLILEHDPFNHGSKSLTKFEVFLEEWRNTGPLIVNLKSEGIEEACIKLIRKFDVKSWFFLDLSMPYFVKYAKLAASNKLAHFSSSNLAVRFSDYEPIEYALSFSKSASWVWVDCFDGKPISTESYEILKSKGFRLCFVSPELQNFSLDHLVKFKEACADSGIVIDAVCTKRPDLWINS